MILCDTEIRAALKTGQIKIIPPPTEVQFTTSSVDLTLGTEFKRWKSAVVGLESGVDPSIEGYNYADIAAELLEACPLESDGSLILQPRSFTLGITAERVELPTESRIAARVEGRSSLGRLGVGVHVTAPTIHSGFRGQIALEITNQGTRPIRVRPGMRICQLIFELVFGTPGAAMSGVFQDQQSVSGKR